MNLHSWRVKRDSEVQRSIHSGSAVSYLEDSQVRSSNNNPHGSLLQWYWQALSERINVEFVQLES